MSQKPGKSSGSRSGGAYQRDLLRREETKPTVPRRVFDPHPKPEPPRKSKRGPVIGVIGTLLAGIAIVVGVTQTGILDQSPSATNVDQGNEVFVDTLVVATQAPLGEPTRSPVEIVEEVSPAVVMVQGAMQGSGVLIDSRGFVVTNAHVVGPMNQVIVSLNENDEHFKAVNGQVVGVSPCSDLALIRLPDGTYPAITSLSSEPVERLSQVFALGYPRVDSPIPLRTDGMVNIAQTALWGIPAVIEHTTPLNEGNSGGPLFDAQGQLIGINVMTRGQGTSMSYSISLGYAFQEWRRLGNDLPPAGTRLKPDQTVVFELDNNIEKRCFVFDGQRDTTITLKVRSVTKLNDPHLVLFGPSNMQLRDNGVGNWDEELSMLLEADGVYMAVVSSQYENDETYEVTLTVK